MDSKCRKSIHCNYEDVDLEGLIEAKNKRWLDPTVITSMIAVNEAVEMSGLDFPDDTPVFVGTIRGGAPKSARYGQILHQQKRKVHPQILLSSSHEYVSNHISSHYKWHGASMGTSGTCNQWSTSIRSGQKIYDDRRIYPVLL